MKITFKYNRKPSRCFKRCDQFDDFLPFCIQEIREDICEYHFKTKNDFSDYLTYWCIQKMSCIQELMICANGEIIEMNGYYEFTYKVIKFTMKIKDKKMNSLAKMAKQIMIEELYNFGMRGK